MTIDVVRVRTPRSPRDEPDERPPHHRDAIIDVSAIPAEEIETYVERAVGDDYDASLERRGTKAFLTAVRTPRPRKLTEPASSAMPEDADRRTPDRPAHEWDYAVFATERTPQ